MALERSLGWGAGVRVQGARVRALRGDLRVGVGGYWGAEAGGGRWSVAGAGGAGLEDCRQGERDSDRTPSPSESGPHTFCQATF